MKKKYIILPLTIVFILIAGIVQATSGTYTVKMDLLGTQFKEGETIDILVKIQDINLPNGIVAFSTMLEYDDEVFEEPIISSAGHWQQPIMVENLIQSVTENMEDIKGEQEVIKLTFKIKDQAKLGNTKICLKEFEVSDGENTIGSEAIEKQIKIIDGEVILQNDLKENNYGQIIIIVLLVIIIVITIFMILFMIYLFKKYNDKILHENRTYIERRKEDRRKGDRRQQDRRK